jgi:hypothetical protein
MVYREEIFILASSVNPVSFYVNHYFTYFSTREPDIGYRRRAIYLTRLSRRKILC